MKNFLIVLVLAVSSASAFAGERIVGVGIALSAKDHHIHVTGLVPGAPAALQGTLRAGDEIISVKPFEGDSPGWLPVERLSLDEFVQLVRGDAGTRVGLHLANASGQYQVYLTRAEFEAP